jgi:hypothetical protein
MASAIGCQHRHRQGERAGTRQPSSFPWLRRLPLGFLRRERGRDRHVRDVRVADLVHRLGLLIPHLLPVNRTTVLRVVVPEALQADSEGGGAQGKIGA